MTMADNEDVQPLFAQTLQLLGAATGTPISNDEVHEIAQAAGLGWSKNKARLVKRGRGREREGHAPEHPPKITQAEMRAWISAAFDHFAGG